MLRDANMTPHCALAEAIGMSEDWLGRWATGRTGWHETDGNAGLRTHWPAAQLSGADRQRVLVPFCGKTLDLLWLIHQGYEVVGVELAEVAVRQFFAENDLEFEVVVEENLHRFIAKKLPLSISCGDYWGFSDPPFDALYDRGALVALPHTMRRDYVEHTKTLLLANAVKMVVTLEYDQSIVAGPPFAVHADELTEYWSDLRRVGQYDDLQNCPPKFRTAGITDVQEVVWLSS
jgi:thiopurine S-methyltransferase